MKHELTKKLGLEIYRNVALRQPDYVVDADDLEKVLQNATVVKRKKDTTLWTDNFGVFTFPPDEQALLICVEEIKREPLKHELEHSFCSTFDNYSVLVPRQFRGKKFKVQITEVQE